MKTNNKQGMIFKKLKMQIVNVDFKLLRIFPEDVTNAINENIIKTVNNVLIT